MDSKAFQYHRSSREPRYSILLALPLLLLYEGLVLLLEPPDAGIRNGADVMLKSVFRALGGSNGMLYFNLLLFGTGAWLVARDWRRNPGRLKLEYFGMMLCESLFLAILIYFGVGSLTRELVGMALVEGSAGFSLPERLMLPLGAGIYEELLFRVLLIGGPVLLGSRLFHWDEKRCGMVATLVAALIFSAMHYVGPYAYPLDLGTFVFRFLAGLALGWLYLLRGLGVTAWTHAWYDLMVVILSLW